ncbi:MAG: hypothetical protein Q8Q50_00090 [Methylobacter sp.]|nr:hypothetical protein [Methylobacter sp.]
MPTEAISTVVKMLGTLPDATQNQVIEHLQAYIADLQDELRWDATFTKNQSSLVQQAQLAKQQIAEGKARPLNINDL